MTKPTRQQVLDAARKWIGTPFKHQGRLLGVGADCAGIVIGTAHALGISDFDFLEYNVCPNPELMGLLLDQNLISIPKEEAKSGDLLWLRVGKKPRHLAIKTDVGILHSFANVGRCVETSLDAFTAATIYRAYRYPGVID
jgi:cell wall-associated NlpC family hydrolase